ncbi:hypothetical protein KR018_007102, partial [Drosophila ironensis]
AMINFGDSLKTLTLLSLLCASSAQDASPSNSIAKPGEPLYYLNADAGLSVAPNESLKRTNRSLLKWWDDLFLRNNCCNNNLVLPQALPVAPIAPPVVPNNCNNGLQFQELDPFKQVKLFKKLPDLFPTPTPCGQPCGGCGGQQPQPQSNYVAPLIPSYGGEGYVPVPNNEYDGPGDGDAGYVAPPPSDSYVAPPPPPPPPAATYEAPAPTYGAPVAPAPVYDPPAPPASSYEVPAPAPVPPAQSQLPPIVYQPIIYVSTPPASKSEVQINEQKYASPPAPVYGPNDPPASYGATLPAYSPPTPSYATPSCQTPIQMSLIDQPYRVAPELFEEYNYRLALEAQNIL